MPSYNLRHFGCPGCGARANAVGGSPWCRRCQRHLELVTPDFPRPADPAREARIVAHRARVERELPQKGTTDPLDCFSRRAL